MANEVGEIIAAVFDGLQKESAKLQHSIQDAEFSIGYHQGFLDGIEAGKIQFQNSLRELMGLPFDDMDIWAEYDDMRRSAQEQRDEEVSRYRGKI